MSQTTDRLRVSSPCSENWEEMKGSEKTRICSHCSHNVNDLSKMTRREAHRLVRNSNGRICIRYIPHPETGAPVYADNIYKISRRSGIAAGVLGAALAMSGTAYAQGNAVIVPVREAQTQNEPSKKPHQTENAVGQVFGTLTDPAGAIIPGASVKLSGDSFDQVVASDENGLYQFANVPSGTLKLTFNSAGFESKTVSLTLSDGEAKTLDLTLEIGELTTMGVMMMVEYEHPIVRAAAEDDLESLATLIFEGENVNAKDNNAGGSTALHLAVENGNYQMVELLLNSGAKVNVRNDEKRTPLLMLEFDTDAELIELLLKHGAKINAVDDDGNNALHRASENNEPEVIRLLVREGIDINSRNDEGDTPLMIAAYYEVPDTVSELLNAGAAVNLQNKDGKTALEIANGEEGEDIAKIIELLIQYGARK